MKKQYLRISIAAFFIAALIFSTSCSKKSSDPTPAAPTPTVATSTKPAAPNTAKRETTDAEDGTGRPPLTDISVGAVTVKDQESQRNSGMTSENTAKLDNLTGKGSTQGRFEENSGKTVFGWFIADFTINGVPYTDQQLYDNGLQQALFFNIDSSGYYWAFENKSKTWSWGTYGIDNGMTTLAIDFDEKWVPTEAYTIAKVTEDRLVLTGKFDFDGDGNVDNVIIGLNGYDLSSNTYNGDTKLTAEEKVFVGNWDLQLYIDAATSNTYTDISFMIQINADGTWRSDSESSGTQHGSWVIETIPGIQGQTSSTFYLYASSYDSITKSIVVEKHLVYIEEGEMVMILQETTDPNGQDSVNDQYYFAK